MKEFCKDFAIGAAQGGSIGLLTGAAAGATGLYQVCTLPGQSDICAPIIDALHTKAAGTGAAAGLCIGAIAGGVGYASYKAFTGWLYKRQGGNNSAELENRGSHRMSQSA